MLQYENELLKEYAWALREEQERWKEASKNQAARGLDTLAEASIQFEDPPFIQEKEELICPKCGVLFNLEGYKVDKMKIASCRLANSGQGGNETLNDELAEETRLEEKLVLEEELHVDEAPQPQSSENTELLPSRSRY